MVFTNRTVFLTCCLGEGAVQGESEDGLSQVAQEVLENTTHYIDVIQFVQTRLFFSTKQTLSHFFNQPIRA